VARDLLDARVHRRAAEDGGAHRTWAHRTGQSASVAR
jgi:hypothetical protein